MSQIVLQITMDKSAEAKSEQAKNNSEQYLLLIVIKLTLLIAAKVIKVIVKLYQYHNKKVDQQLPKISQNRQADVEVGNSQKNNNAQIPRKSTVRTKAKQNTNSRNQHINNKHSEEERASCVCNKKQCKRKRYRANES